MPVVLQDSTVTGNTATGQDSNLLNFTKVMLKTDSARRGDADDDLVSQTSERDAGDASGGSGRQLDSFVVTFDRPVDPSGGEFDTQGRLLIGTDGGIWSGAGDDLLIAGRTTFDFRGGITVAVGDMEASSIAAGTPLASVTDLIIDPFNPDRSAVHDVSLTGHSDGADNWEMVVKVLNAETGSPGDGSVRPIPPAVQQPEHESGLVWSGESGGMNGDPAAESYGQQNKLQELRARAVADIDQPSGPEDRFVVDSDAGTVSARQAMLKMFSADYAGTGVADDSVHLPGTSDALAPTAFFLV
jgi:hypothetical protein